MTDRTRKAAFWAAVAVVLAAITWLRIVLIDFVGWSPNQKRLFWTLGAVAAVLLRQEGWPVNHKRTWRLYCDEGLSIRPKVPRRKRAWRYRVGRPGPTAPEPRSPSTANQPRRPRTTA